MGETKVRTASRLARLAASLFAGWALACVATPVQAASSSELNALVQDTQQMNQEAGNMTLVWWLPEQFWAASMAMNPGITQAQIEELLKIIRPYTMIAVVDGKMGAFGGVTFKSDEVVRSAVLLRDAKGESYAPLPESAISPDAKNLLQMLKPIIGNMLGPMGENMHFLMFPAVDKKGAPLADPLHEGVLQVDVAEKSFRYRLPLGSVLPAKYDAATRERFPGNYNFNPYTGDKLTTTPPAAAAAPAAK